MVLVIRLLTSLVIAGSACSCLLPDLEGGSAGGAGGSDNSGLNAGGQLQGGASGTMASGADGASDGRGGQGATDTRDAGRDAAIDAPFVVRDASSEARSDAPTGRSDASDASSGGRDSLADARGADVARDVNRPETATDGRPPDSNCVPNCPLTVSACNISDGCGGICPCTVGICPVGGLACVMLPL
jgi:hypothetical protein